MVAHRDERRGRATSFAEVAGPYERGRPGYPEDAVRWLVGEEPLRPVKERPDDLDLHPLAKRELPDRLAHEVARVSCVARGTSSPP